MVIPRFPRYSIRSNPIKTRVYKWKHLSRPAFEDLIDGAEILSRDRHGLKVVRLTDGCVAKLFRRKRLVSSALIRPYAKRFVRGAEILNAFDIPTVEVTGLVKIRAVKRDMVIYRPLDGATLREALAKEPENSGMLEDLAAFLAKLHQTGIYFRAIHFGNVVLTPDRVFGLIDVSELYYSRSPLTLSKRIRNFKPIFRYREDRDAVLAFGLPVFTDIYLNHAGIREKTARHRFQKGISRILKEHVK